MKELYFEDLKLMEGETLFAVCNTNGQGRNHYFKTIEDVKKFRKGIHKDWNVIKGTLTLKSGYPRLENQDCVNYLFK